MSRKPVHDAVLVFHPTFWKCPAVAFWSSEKRVHNDKETELFLVLTMIKPCVADMLLNKVACPDDLLKMCILPVPATSALKCGANRSVQRCFIHY